MKLFSYVLSHDLGSAPNPFWGHCTLAICKPKIRLSANCGDWVVGIGSASGPNCGKLIYAMQIREILPLEDYFNDPRFEVKKPDPKNADWRRRRGDNQYRKLDDRSWKQLPGPHVMKNMEKDIGGRNSLVSKKFYYFGNKAVGVPEHLAEIAAGGRGHRCSFSDKVVQQFIAWIESTYSVGIHGDPAEGMTPIPAKSCREDCGTPIPVPSVKCEKKTGC